MATAHNTSMQLRKPSGCIPPEVRSMVAMPQRLIVVPQKKLWHQRMQPCKNTKKLVLWEKKLWLLHRLP